MDNNNTKLWLYIPITYYLLNKHNDSINSLRRYIDESNKVKITPNLFAIFKLIKLYLLCYKKEKENIKRKLFKENKNID